MIYLSRLKKLKAELRGGNSLTLAIVNFEISRTELSQALYQIYFRGILNKLARFFNRAET